MQTTHLNNLRYYFQRYLFIYFDKNMTRKCVKITVAKKKIVFDGNSISDAYNWNKTYTYENGKGKKPIDFRVIISESRSLFILKKNK